MTTPVDLFSSINPTTRGRGAMSAATAATTYWRLAGLTYLQYTSKAAGVLRASLKEPLRTKTMAKEKIFYKKLPWSPSLVGQPVGPLKVEVTSLS